MEKPLPAFSAAMAHPPGIEGEVVDALGQFIDSEGLEPSLNLVGRLEPGRWLDNRLVVSPYLVDVRTRRLLSSLPVLHRPPGSLCSNLCSSLCIRYVCPSRACLYVRGGHTSNSIGALLVYLNQRIHKAFFVDAVEQSGWQSLQFFLNQVTLFEQASGILLLLPA